MKFDRLVSIVMLLLSLRSVTAGELARMFEVSVRTVYRDLEAIDRAGLPVVSAPGVGGGFSLMEGFRLDKRLFTTSDVAALLMGLQSVSGLTGDAGANALAKLKSLVPEERADEVERKAGTVTIDLNPWMGRDPSPFLEELKGAAERQRSVVFDYSDQKGARTSRKVEPHRLLLKAGRWYLQGYCLDREDFRLFKLTRISNFAVLDEGFEPRGEPPEVSEFPDEMLKQLGVVVLRIHDSLRDRVLDFCGEDSLTPCEGGFIVRFPFIVDDFGYGLLLSFGDRCECLEPPEVRHEMARRAERLFRIYGG